jgi:hypothetical protein
VGVQVVGWEGGGNEPGGEYTFFYGKGNENHELGTGCVLHKRTITAVKRVRAEATSCEPLNSFSAFCGTQRFIIEFTRALHYLPPISWSSKWSLSLYLSHE